MHSRYWPSSRTRKLNSRILRTFFQCNLGVLCHYCQTSNILQYTTSIYTLCITHYELESEIVLYFTLCTSLFVFRTFHSLFFHIFFQTSFSSTKMACPMIKHHLFNSFFVLKFFFVIIILCLHKNSCLPMQKGFSLHLCVKVLRHI